MTARLWQRLTCGGCGGGFTADPELVPCFPWPCCRDCWGRRDLLRAAAGLPPGERPACYPEDEP